MVTFVSDLDRTLIYSKQSEGVCVEWKEEQKMSFMTSEAKNKFLALLERDDFRFVPCTARSRTLAKRISFLQEKEPEFMICDHGGSIYVAGERDQKWDQFLRMEKIVHPTELFRVYEDVQEVLKQLGISYWNITCNQSLFFVLSFDTKEEACSAHAILEQLYTDERFTFVCQGRKLYYLPIRLNKSLAVSYLKETYSLSNLVTSGDSLFDEDFTALGDMIFLPEHATFHHSKEIRSQNHGMAAGEELVHFLERLVK